MKLSASNSDQVTDELRLSLRASYLRVYRRNVWKHVGHFASIFDLSLNRLRACFVPTEYKVTRTRGELEAVILAEVSSPYGNRAAINHAHRGARTQAEGKKSLGAVSSARRRRIPRVTTLADSTMFGSLNADRTNLTDSRIDRLRTGCNGGLVRTNGGGSPVLTFLSGFARLVTVLL